MLPVKVTAFRDILNDVPDTFKLVALDVTPVEFHPAYANLSFDPILQGGDLHVDSAYDGR